MKDWIEREMRRVASEWYNLPEDDALKEAVSEWGKGGDRGYGIFGYSEEIGEVQHIEKLSDFNIYDTDIAAAKQAAKDGIKIIPFKEQPKAGPFRFYRYIDTKENRNALAKEVAEYNKRMGVI